MLKPFSSLSIQKIHKSMKIMYAIKQAMLKSFWISFFWNYWTLTYTMMFGTLTTFEKPFSTFNSKNNYASPPFFFFFLFESVILLSLKQSARKLHWVTKSDTNIWFWFDCYKKTETTQQGLSMFCSQLCMWDLQNKGNDGFVPSRLLLAS